VKRAAGPYEYVWTTMVAFKNNVKTAVLLGALFGLLVWVGSYWGTGGMVGFGIMAVVMNFGAWFFSDRIAVAAMRGRRVGPDGPGAELYDIVRTLADRAGLPMPRVYVCPQEAPNAFATGRNPSHAAVAVTQGALHLLDREELAGVLGHELAHVKNRDTLTSTVAATVAGLFSMLAYWGFLFGIGRDRGGNPLVLLGVVLLGAVGAALIKAMISRSREFVADADGARIAGSPHGLVSALRKLESYAKRIPMQNPNPAMNNMFIVEPFSGGRTLMNLFASHPPTEQRIAALLGG
jgi:heat shock protein HtpX